MKERRIIILISLIIFFFLVRLHEEKKKEIVNLAEFTEYYEKSLADNGGFELIESFYTFEKTYNFPGEYLEIPTEKQKKVKEEKPKITKSIYVIQKGDSLSKIAQKHGISVEAIVANNPKLNKNLIAGTKINIVSEDGVFYKLQKGDSVSRIAVKFKVKTADILKYNDVNAKNMRVGEELFLKNPDYTAFNKKPQKKPRVVKSKSKNQSQNYQDNYIASGGKGFGMPVRYAGVSSPYGNRYHPVLRRYILHTGVDLVAKYVPLRASKAGVVSFAGNMSGYGKIIIIKHENGYETRYAHLSQISTRVGEHVEKGELIGKTGNTGRTTGPHLHFEIRKNGKTLNPMKYL